MNPTEWVLPRADHHFLFSPVRMWRLILCHCDHKKDEENIGYLCQLKLNLQLSGVFINWHHSRFLCAVCATTFWFPSISVCDIRWLNMYVCVSVCEWPFIADNHIFMLTIFHSGYSFSLVSAFFLLHLLLRIYDLVFKLQMEQL